MSERSRGDDATTTTRRGGADRRGQPLEAVDRWPMVGRTGELGQIRTAAAQGGGGVLLVGAPGVGRSRLAREAARLLATEGQVAWAFATRDASGIPFGALLHLLRSGDPPVPGGPGTSGVLDVALRLTQQLAADNGSRRLLVVDDAHLLDDASAAVVGNVANRGAAFVLATVRSRAAVPDSITRLWADEVLTRVEVAPLAEPAVDTLLGRMLDGPTDAVSRRTLRRLTAGRPQLLRELVQAGLETAALRRVDGVWHWTQHSYVTDRLADLRQARTAGLSPEANRALETIACAGEVPQAMLDDLAGEAATVEAERCGLVMAVCSGGRVTYRLAYPVDGDIIRARLPRARAQEIWRQLAEAIAKTPMRREDDLLQLVVWRRNAHLSIPAQQLVDAGRRAGARLELDLAERLCVAARREGGGWQADLALAGVLAQQGRYQEAAAVLPAPIRSDTAAEAARVRLRELLRDPATGDRTAVPDGSTATGPAAEAATGPERGTAAGAETAAVRAWTALRSGRVREALQRGAAILDRPTAPVDAVPPAAAVAIAAAGLTGEVDRLDPLADSARTAIGEQPPWSEVLVDGVRCLATALAVSPRAAAQLAERGYRQALRGRPALVVAAWSAIRGIVAVLQGRAGTAQSYLREAVVLLRGADPLRLAHIYLAELATAYAIGGKRGEAERWLARAQEHGPAPGILSGPWLARARAWVRAAAGDAAGGAELAIGAADLARDHGQITVEAGLLFDAARLGQQRTAGCRLSRLAHDHRAVPTIQVFADTVAAVNTADPVRLEDCAGRLEHLGYLLPAAEQATTAYRLHAGAGHRLRANAALARAQRLRDACDGASTPLLDTGGVRTVLTRRELQVAHLAAEGLSDRAVAAKLGLALRTVNNHLTRIYSKLGVAGRAQLADVLSTAAGEATD